MMDFIYGVFTSLIAGSFVWMVMSGRQVVAEIRSFADSETMTHDKLDDQVSMFCPVITLTLEQARDLVNAHESLTEHFDEAMLRKAELHREVAEVARVANRLQDELDNALLERDHCRACCDELRDKLDAKGVVAVEVKGVIDFADAVYESGELPLTDAEWLKSFAVEYTHNIHVCEAEQFAKAGAV